MQHESQHSSHGLQICVRCSKTNTDHSKTHEACGSFNCNKMPAFSETHLVPADGARRLPALLSDIIPFFSALLLPLSPLPLPRNSFVAVASYFMLMTPPPCLLPPPAFLIKALEIVRAVLEYSTSLKKPGGNDGVYNS